MAGKFPPSIVVQGRDSSKFRWGQEKASMSRFIRVKLQFRCGHVKFHQFRCGRVKRPPSLVAV